MTRKPTRYTGVYERTSTERIYKSKPDICFDVTYKVGGRKVWEKVGWVSEGYTAKLADQVRAERIRSLRHGLDLPKQRIAPLFGDVAKKYLEWLKTDKSKNIASDQSRYDNHLKPRFERKSLAEISPLDLERVKSKMTKAGYTAQTIKHVLALFRRTVNKAILWGLWDGKNPVSKVSLPRPNNIRQRFLSTDEARILLDKLREKSSTLHDMALLALHTGMRAGEIFALRACDLNFSHDVITILDPKNGETRQAYMTHMVHEMLIKRKTENPEVLVFTDRLHKNKIRGISNTFDKVVKDLGLNNGVTDPRQKVTFHSLRHTFASWLALQGESLVTIRELLGHKSYEMTKRYAHLIPDEKRKATLRLETSFKQERELNIHVHDN